MISLENLIIDKSSGIRLSSEMSLIIALIKLDSLAVWEDSYLKVLNVKNLATILNRLQSQ